MLTSPSTTQAVINAFRTLELIDPKILNLKPTGSTPNIEVGSQFRIRHNVILRVHHDIFLQLDRHAAIYCKYLPGDERSFV